MDGGAMPRAEKVERVAELREQITGSDALLLTEYRGLTVSEITELRRSLRGGGASFAVVKNTLMQRAASEAGIELTELLRGPSAVAFVSGDPVAAAKSIKAAIRLYPTLVLKGGYMDGSVLTAEQANGLADLESREVMLSKIAGLAKGEMSRAASMFQSAQARFLSLLEAFKDKVPTGAAPPGVGSPAEESGTDDAGADGTTEAAGDEEAPVDEETTTDSPAAEGETGLDEEKE